MTPASALIVFGALVCTVAGQLLFRSAALAANQAGSFQNSRTLMFFAIAVGLYGVMTILWAQALRELSLARAYPFMALSFLLIPLAEHQIFDQPLPWQSIAGGVIIIIGVVVTQSA